MHQVEKAPSSQRKDEPEDEPLVSKQVKEDTDKKVDFVLTESNREEQEKLRASLLEERKRADDYLNRLKYLQADFENYRKRIKRDIDEAVQFGKEKLILNLLNIVDELELAVQAGEKTENKEAITEGVKVTLRKLYDLLRSEGVTTIETIGKPFDPRLHDAVSTAPKLGCQTPIVLEEIRKGFIMYGKVIRPSIVTVATPASLLKTKEEMTPLMVTKESKPLMVDDEQKVKCCDKGEER
ncbi:MAG: nucleotide exchange factor GrpE [Thermoproteota archaeon]